MRVSAFPKTADRPYHLFTAEYEELRATVRDLLDKRLTARAGEVDRSAAFPRELLEELGSLGFLGLAFPAEVGGADDPVAAAVLAEELGRTGVYGFAAAVFHHLSAALAVAVAGDDHARSRVPAALGGRELWALALTEPHLDPEPGCLESVAVRTEGGWTLTGTKSFVANAAAAEVIVAAARVTERPALFVLDASAVATSRQDTLAWWPCETGEVVLDDVRLPATAALGGDAIDVLATVRRWQALCEALALAGLARRAVDDGIAYGLERTAFDRPVATFQVWRHRWADAGTEAEMARASALRALRCFVHGEPSDRAIASARLYAGRTAFRLADECLQMHGGYGYMMEYPAQRYWRDARQATVVGGGDHPWLETIARHIGL